MPKRVPTLRAKRTVDAADADAKRQEDQRRGSAASRGYNVRWRKARCTFLKREPLCVCCTANGVTNAAYLVDHIEPHRGDTAKFWDTGNWQALCGWCHDNIKSSIERAWEAGTVTGAKLSLNRKVAGWIHPADRDR